MATCYGGSLQLTPSMLFALGFVFMFTIGGLSGVVLANASLDIAFHDKLVNYCNDNYNINNYLFISKINLNFYLKSYLQMYEPNYSLNTTLLLSILKKQSKKDKDKNMKIYWVGLMDSSGDIQVNVNKKKGKKI